MAIAQDLNTLKTKEQGLTQNKVSRFAYTQNAYDNDTVTGVSDYVPSRDMNVPLGTAEIMKVNPTIPDKGWRAQASALTRMLMNHFLGRISYNLNKAHDNFLSFLTSLQGSLGTANGIATLDENGRIPYSQLPESAIEYKGTWNADTNTPTLADGTGTLGDMYIVSVAGTQNLGSGVISFDVGDRILYDGSVWQKLSSGGGGGDVASVNGVLPDPVTKNVEVKADDISTESLSIMDFGQGSVDWNQGAFSLYIKDVYYANGIWVSVGTSENNTINWSEDGKNWTPAIFDTAIFDTAIATPTCVSVYYADEIWVAVGYKTYWSEDGKNWHAGTVTVMHGFNKVYYADGIWVACSAQEGIYWSEDGKNWYQSSSLSLGNVRDVCYSGGVWVVAVNSKGLWWSEDGKNWTHVTGTTVTYNFLAVSYAGGRFYAGDATYGTYISTDGKNWSQPTMSMYNLASVCLAQVLKAEDGYVALDFVTDKLVISVNGFSWSTPTSLSSISFKTVFYAEGIFVAGSLSNQGVWVSTDVSSWTQCTGASNGSFNAVYYANNLWVAGSEGNGLWWSEKGLTKNVEKILAYLLSKVG